MEEKDSGLWRIFPQDKKDINDKREGPLRSGVTYIPLCPGTVACVTDTDETSFVDEVPPTIENKVYANFSNYDGKIPSGTWKKVKDMLALQKRLTLLRNQNKAP